jgi:hypothetical protein
MTRSDLITSSRVSSIRQSYSCQIGVGKSDDAHWLQNQMGGKNLTFLFSVVSDGLENLTMLIGCRARWVGKIWRFSLVQSQTDGKICLFSLVYCQTDGKSATSYCCRVRWGKIWLFSVGSDGRKDLTFLGGGLLMRRKNHGLTVDYVVFYVNNQLLIRMGKCFFKCVYMVYFFLALIGGSRIFYHLLQKDRNKTLIPSFF